MKKIAISIIVPVYNTEKYLKKCLDSLVNQSLSNIEIICINDGSKDNSLKILKEYKNNYKDKIIIIDKKNEGVWKGRVDGVRKAKGEYIGFVDSDDYVEEDYSLKLYSNAKRYDSDISVCGFKRIDLLTGKVYSKEMVKSSKYNFDINKNPENLLMLNGAPWNKIFKASLFKNMYKINNIPRVLDDMLFASLLYINASKVSFVQDFLINYMVRSDSIMNTIKEEIIPGVYKSMVEVRDYYKENNKKLLEYYDVNAFLHLGVSLMYRVYENDNFKKIYLNNLIFMNKHFPKYKKSKYLKISYIIKHNFINNKLWIMKVLYNLRLYRLFLGFYIFMIKTFKIDIKW